MKYTLPPYTLALIVILTLPLSLSPTCYAFEPDDPGNLPLTEESDLDDTDPYDEAMESELFNENLLDETETGETWE